MERRFDEELNLLKEKILYMSSIVEIMIHNALSGLRKRNYDQLNKVLECEKEINILHIKIDEMCINLIALHQPMAQDLRFIAAAMKINSELERIGDQSVNIVQNAQELIKLPKQDLLIDIENMASIMIKMVKESMDAFVKRDAELAEKILLKDNDVDNLKRKVFNELLNNLKLDIKPEINRNIELLLISRNIEKIADHATNICEDVIFMTLGKDIRHHNIIEK